MQYRRLVGEKYDGNEFNCYKRANTASDGEDCVAIGSEDTILQDDDESPLSGFDVTSSAETF